MGRDIRLSPHVNQSLSRGLADRALAMFDRQSERYRNSLELVLRHRVRSKKAVARLTKALKEHGERAALIQTVGSSPNGRHVTICQFVPRLVRQREHPGVEFLLYQYKLSPDGLRRGPDTGKRLAAGEHAVERLFQRLNTLDVAKVTVELHDAVLLALPLCAIARALDLRQLPVPTTSGSFLCDVDPRAGTVEAKTWLATEAIGDRWWPVVSDVRSAVTNAGGEQALAMALSMEIDASLREELELYAKLRSALARHSWLREEYTARPDPIGERWRLAHLAAAAQSRPIGGEDRGPAAVAGP